MKARFGNSIAFGDTLMVVGAPRPFRQEELRNDENSEDSQRKGPGDVVTYRLGDHPNLIPTATLNGNSCHPGRFGFSLDLLADATLVVGAPRGLYPPDPDADAKTETGLVKIFEWDDDPLLRWNCIQTLTPDDDAYWPCQSEKDTVPELTGTKRFGQSVAIAEGAIVVGAPGDDGGLGSVSVYIYEPEAQPPQWIRAKKLLPTGEDAREFGRIVDIGSDGNTIVVGACDRCGLCATRACENDGRIECTEDAQCRNGAHCVTVCDNDTSVSCNANGPNDECGARNSGTVTIFEGQGNSWAVKARFTQADLGGTFTRLGVTAAIAGDHVVMGAPGDGEAAGEAFTSDRGDQGWSALEPLSPRLTGVSLLRFGETVAISEEAVLVAAPGAIGDVSPKVYPFQRTVNVQASTNLQVPTLRAGQDRGYDPPPSNDPADCCYGRGLAVKDGRVAISCSCNDPGTVQVGKDPALLCGNRQIDENEGCDDGNARTGDGCSGGCQREACWTCSGTPSTCAQVSCQPYFACNTDTDECEARPCGDSTDDGSILASDALKVLKAAVTGTDCPAFICGAFFCGAPKTTCTLLASNALAILRKAVTPTTDLCCGACPP